MQQVLCELCAKDERNVFYFPLDESLFEGYREMIHRPLSFATISTKVTLFTGKEIPTPLKYTWQHLEDDVVTLLQNSIMFNKYHSEYGTLAIRLLGELPSLFVDDEGEMCYSRSSAKAVSATTKAPPVVGSKRGRDASSSSEIVGDLFAHADQLQEEALMLDFLALWKRHVSSVLVSTLLTAPYSPKPSQFQAHVPANHNIPLDVLSLEFQVIQHKIPTYSAFVRIVDMMLALAIGSTIDVEAVDILVSFKTKLQSTITGKISALLVSHELIDERLLSAFTPFVNSYQPTFTTAPGVNTQVLTHLQTELKQKFSTNHWLLKILEGAPTDNLESEPHFSTYVVERVLQTLKVADFLGKQDSNFIFAFPFLSKSYMDKCTTPINFFTMKMKAISGLYFFQVARYDKDAKATPFIELVGMDITPSAVKTALRTDLDFMVDNSVVFNGPDHVASQLSTSLRKQLNEIASTKAGIAAY